MNALKKAAILSLFACLLLIAAKSGYWAHRPYSYSKCEALAVAVPVYGNSHLSSRQLSYEAEFAEDLAIRYADACCGPQSGHFETMEEYGRKRDECITQLFQVIERSYGFTDQEVRASLTRRPIEVDAAIMISFFIIYVGVGKAVAFRIWRMRDYGSFHTKLITVYAALLLGFAFVLVGGLWYDLIESIRIGNGHVSYRGERAPWDYHHVAEYVAGVVTFCVTVVVQRRTAAAEVLHRPVSDSNLEAGRWLS